MKRILLTISLLVLGCSLSQASITSIPTWDYSGGVYCYSPVFDSGAQSVGISGYQSSYGSIGLTIMTDTPADPTLTVNNSIDNETTFLWTEYVVSVAMNQSFSINSAGVVAPAGWTATITQPGTPVSGVYTGTIDYLGGTPVAIYPGANSILNYGYQVTFGGSTSYSLTESANPVPEPGMLGLILAGGTLMGIWLVANRRWRSLA
jgi:hypothetical protein